MSNNEKNIYLCKFFTADEKLCEYENFFVRNLKKRDKLIQSVTPGQHTKNRDSWNVWGQPPCQPPWLADEELNVFKLKESIEFGSQSKWFETLYLQFNLFLVVMFLKKVLICLIAENDRSDLGCSHKQK